jgi:hypothetical protein
MEVDSLNEVSTDLVKTTSLLLTRIRSTTQTTLRPPLFASTINSLRSLGLDMDRPLKRLSLANNNLLLSNLHFVAARPRSIFDNKPLEKHPTSSTLTSTATTVPTTELLLLVEMKDGRTIYPRTGRINNVLLPVFCTTFFDFTEMVKALSPA